MLLHCDLIEPPDFRTDMDVLHVEFNVNFMKIKEGMKSNILFIPQRYKWRIHDIKLLKYVILSTCQH